MKHSSSRLINTHWAWDAMVKGGLESGDWDYLLRADFF